MVAGPRDTGGRCRRAHPWIETCIVNMQLRRAALAKQRHTAMGKDLPKQLHRPVGRLTILDRQIERARRDLRALWRAASPADRLFSVERLLQETALPPEIARQLHDVQDAVRDAWATARTSFVMSSADLARPRVRGLCTLAVPEHPQTCALEHARSRLGCAGRRLIEGTATQHGDDNGEQAIDDATNSACVVRSCGSQARVDRSKARVPNRRGPRMVGGIS